MRKLYYLKNTLMVYLFIFLVFTLSLQMLIL